MIDAFKRAGVTEAAMAGGIARARLADSFAPDARAIAMLARVGRFSDDALLRAIAAEIESDGIAMIDPVPMLDDALAARGRMAGPEPSAAQLKDLRLAFGVMRALGSFDIGQAVAVRDGVVAAVEAVEGTDAALRRSGGAVWPRTGRREGGQTGPGPALRPPRDRPRDDRTAERDRRRDDRRRGRASADSRTRAHAGRRRQRRSYGVGDGGESGGERSSG